MPGTTTTFDTGKQPISMGSVKSTTSFSSSSSFSSSPSSSPPPSPGSDKTIGGNENIEGVEKSIEGGEENAKKTKAKKKKRGAQARANHEARKRERRGFNGEYSSQSFTSSSRVPTIISGTGSYSATGRQIVQDLFSIYGLPKLNKPFELNPAAPSWGNQHQINYHNNMSVRRAPAGDLWSLSQRGFHTPQQNELGNRVLSEAAGIIPNSRVSNFEDTIMGNTTDGHGNGGGYDDYHDESLYNPARFTQTYFSRPQELTSPVSDTTSYPLTDSEVDTDLTKATNPVNRGVVTAVELSKIQSLLSKIQIEDCHNEEQVVNQVEEEGIKSDECTIMGGVEFIECKTEEEVLEPIQSNSPETGKLDECTREEAITPIEPGLGEVTGPVEWILIRIMDPTKTETIIAGDCKDVKKVFQPAEYVLSEAKTADCCLTEANESVECKAEKGIITKVEDSSPEDIEPTQCKVTEKSDKSDNHNGSEIIKPSEYKTEVEVINRVQVGSTEVMNETSDELHQNVEFETERDLLGNDETTIFASEKMLEKLRARIIQEYKERIKDCEAELQEKEAALQDQKLISQKKQECLENYMNITEGLTNKVSGLNKSLDQEKKTTEQAVKKEHETAELLKVTQEAFQKMRTLVDVQRRKAEDATRREYNAVNELEVFTGTFDCLQTRMELEEANAKAAMRKEHETARQLKIMMESFKTTKARMEKEEARAKKLAKKDSETAKQLKLVTEAFKTLQAQASEDKKRAEQAIKKESDTAKQLTIMTESLKEMRMNSEKDKKKIEKAAKKESDTAKRLEAAVEALKEMQVNVEKERIKTKNAAEKEADTAKKLEAMAESLKEVRAGADEEKKKSKSEITRIKKMNKALEKSAIEKESKITKELEALKESLKEMQAFIDEEEKKAEKAAKREANTSKQVEVMEKSLQQHVSTITALVSEKMEMQRIIDGIAQQNSFLKAKEEADNELLKNSYKIVRNLKDCFKFFLPRSESNTAIVKIPVSIVIMANSNIKQLKKLMQTNESIEYEQALARKEKSDAIDSTILKMDTEKMAKDLVLWRAKCKELEANTAIPAKVSTIKPIPTVYTTISNPPAILKLDTSKKDSDIKGQVQTTKAKRGGGGRGGSKVKGKGKRVAIADVFDFTNGIPENVNLEDGMRTLLGRVSPKFGERNNQQPK